MVGSPTVKGAREIKGSSSGRNNSSRMHAVFATSGPNASRAGFRHCNSFDLHAHGADKLLPRRERGDGAIAEFPGDEIQ